jgi:hypothetical protein
MRDYKMMNRTMIITDLNNLEQWWNSMASSCDNEGKPWRKIVNNWDKCASTWADMLVADEMTSKLFKMRNTDWKVFS